MVHLKENIISPTASLYNICTGIPSNVLSTFVNSLSFLLLPKSGKWMYKHGFRALHAQSYKAELLSECREPESSCIIIIILLLILVEKEKYMRELSGSLHLRDRG